MIFQKQKKLFMLLFCLQLTLVLTADVYGQKGKTSGVLLNKKNNSNTQKIKVINPTQFKALMQKSFDKNRPLFINVWSSKSPSYPQQLASLEKAYKKYGKSRIDFLIVSVDNHDDLPKLSEFVAARKYEMPIYLIKDNAPITWYEQQNQNLLPLKDVLPYGTDKLPLTLMYDAQGRLPYMNNEEMPEEKLIRFLGDLLRTF